MVARIGVALRADDHAGGPGGVQDVQVVRAVVREERGDQRIRHGFEGAVGEGEDEHPAEQAVVGQGFGGFPTVTGDSGEGDER